MPYLVNALTKSCHVISLYPMMQEQATGHLATHAFASATGLNRAIPARDGSFPCAASTRLPLAHVSPPISASSPTYCTPQQAYFPAPQSHSVSALPEKLHAITFVPFSGGLRRLHGAPSKRLITGFWENQGNR